MVGLGAAAANGEIPCWNGAAYMGCGMCVSGMADVNAASGFVIPAIPAIPVIPAIPAIPAILVIPVMLVMAAIPGSDGIKAVVPI